MRRRVLVILTALSLLATACTSESATSGTSVVTPMVSSASDAAGVTSRATASATPSATATATATPTQASSPSQPSTLVIWGRGGVTRDLAIAARSVDGVEAVGFRRRETVGLVRAMTAGGEVVLGLSDGFRVPLAAISLDVGSGLVASAAYQTLSPGQVLLPATSAALRGLDVGATIDLVERAGLVVAAVVPDEVTGTNEVVLHPDDADALGWDDAGVVILEHRRDDVEALEAELLALVPADAPGVRVIDPDDTGARGASLVLPSALVKRQFGEFSYRPRPGVREVDIEAAWVEANIVSASVPLLGTVRCHRDIIDDITAVLDELVERGLGGAIDPDGYAGCFYARQTGTSPDDAVSRHSWGIALDINVDVSAPGGGIPLPTEVIEVFQRRGFRWGGDFPVADNHHFEWIGVLPSRSG